MNWTIKSKLLAGFCGILCILLVVGLWAIKLMTDTEHFANIEMVSALAALDGTMESRINYLHAIWGTLEASSKFENTSQSKGVSRIESATIEFSKTIELIRESGMISDSEIQKLSSLFQELSSKSQELRKLAIEKNEAMEKLDKLNMSIVDDGSGSQLSAKANNLFWLLTMAANEYATYGITEVKTKYEDILSKARVQYENQSTLFNSLQKLSEAANYLIEISDKLSQIDREFKEIAEELDSEMEILEEGSTEQEGADAYATRLLSELKDKVANAKITLFISLAIGISCGLFVGLVLANKISQPLRKITSIAKLIAKGDLSQKVDIRQKDEIGQLADAFRALTLDLTAKAEAADQIAQGILSVDVKAVSDEDVLGKAMVTMKESLITMQVDLNAVIEAQMAGDIDGRCHPNKLTGAYAELLQGVNDTLDVVIKPILEGIEIMQEYAKGNLKREMRTLPGKQIILTEGLNSIRKNLQALINEGLMLAKAAEEGRLQTRGETSRFEGGYREILQGMNTTIDNLLQPVNAAIECLDQMAMGDLTVEITGDYQGDHAGMKEAVNSTLNSLNNILYQVNITVDQVSNGSKQVSDSSNSLSQGATEQASSLEEITSSMTEMGSQTKQNADNATQANQLATSASSNADQGNKQMKQMLDAMREINDASGNISKIIKVIDEIAFQTNLLALNAAVEAARAGVHGKGFAVVAEEVRNLAKRSAKAAKETTELIEGSVKKVENGTEIAQKTATALADIVNGITKATDLVGEIASASNEQAQGIEQVNQSLGQIDQVTQSNTANAEESAAAAQELSSQAAQLKRMLSKFKIREQTVHASETLVQEVTEVENIPEPVKSSGWGNRQATKKTKMNNPAEVITLDDDDFGKF